MVIGGVAAAALAAMTLLVWPDAPRLAAVRRAAATVPPPAVRRTGRPAMRGAGRREPRPPFSAAGRWWRGRDRSARSRLPALAAAALLALAASRLVPWPVVIAGALAGCTVTSLVRHARTAVRSRRELAGLAQALRGVVRELRAGAAPRTAIDQAAAGAAPATRLLLESLAPRESASRDALAPLPSTAVPSAVTDQLRRAWAVSDTHGIPLAAVLSACVADLDDRAALARLRAQHVAGPAVSGYVLAALPAAGLAMGAGMGSHPVDVLTGSALGGTLLVAGVTLCCAGLLWSGRIVRGGRHD